MTQTKCSMLFQARFPELLTALMALHAVEGAAHKFMGCPAFVPLQSAASLQRWAWVPLLRLVTCATCAAASCPTDCWSAKFCGAIRRGRPCYAAHKVPPELPHVW